MKFTQNIIKIGVPNHNGRVYSEECINNMLRDPIIQEKLSSNMFFGELYSKNESINEDINMSKIAFNIKSLYIEDECLKADAETLPTPMGDELEKLLKEDKVYMFSIGTGDLDEDNNVIPETYKLNSFGVTHKIEI